MVLHTRAHSFVSGLHLMFASCCTILLYLFCSVEGVDPFMAQKMLGVTSALKSMEALAERLLATDVSKEP